MDCRETLLLISSHLDGTLTKEEEAVLAEHVAACENCTRELALQERLSGALRAISREEVQAPPELCGLVMAKLRAERRSALPWLPVAWRKAAAAAAAVLLIAGGSAGVTAGLKIADIGKMLGYQTTAPTVVAANNNEPATSEKAPGDSANPLAGSTQPPGDVGSPAVNDNGNTTENNRNNGTSIVAGDSSTGGSKTTTTVAAAPSSEGPRALLSSGMKVTSTVLRMAVDDLSGARAKAVALAASSGAETQVFPEQNGDKKIVVIRLTTTPDQAPVLFAGLTRLGTQIDRQDDTQDNTSRYNETLVQLQDLQARASTTENAVEKRQLEAQAASDKQLLESWATEVGKRVITLWLESR